MTDHAETTTTEIADLAGGCFWCLEAVYDELEGVRSVESGYMGGHLPDPTYEAVCSGRTGHAEMVRVTFEPSSITYRQILEVFFAIHDPTTLNRQGNDVGTQYRSAIFYRSDEQKREAEAMIAWLEQEKVFERRIVTQVVPADTFYIAEDYHQEFYARNPNQGYCQFVVSPKLAKFRKQFAARRKATAG